jgi:mannose-6-phosphate isomerase-like protein (cupin superfamily)
MTATDATTALYREFANPATKELITFTQTAEDSGPDVARFNWRSLPGGSIIEHVHPSQEERFIISTGEAHFTVDGHEHVIGPGETILVPAGTRHSQSNPGTTAIEGVVELRPALRTKEMHEAFGGLATEGKTTPRGAPTNPLQLGATLWHFRRENRVTSPPVWLQNLVLPPLAAIAKAFRVRPYYDRWDTRIPPRTTETHQQHRSEQLDAQRRDLT